MSENPMPEINSGFPESINPDKPEPTEVKSAYPVPPSPPEGWMPETESSGEMPYPAEFTQQTPEEDMSLRELSGDYEARSFTPDDTRSDCDLQTQDAAYLEQPPVDWQFSVEENHGQPGDASYGTPPYSEPPRPNFKPVIIALGIVVSLVLVAGIGVFAFYDAIMLRFNPENYLKTAIEKTIVAVGNTKFLLPDFQKFQGNPTMRELTLHMDETSDASIQTLEDSYLRVSAKSDLERRRMLLEFSIQSSYLTMNDNKLYISDDLVGIESPYLLPKYGMLTANPATFVNDWNKSGYSDYLSEIPSDFNLPELLDEIFDTFDTAAFSSVSEDEGMASFEIRLQELAGGLEAASPLTYEGETTLPVDGESREYKHFKRVCGRDSVNQFIKDFAKLYFEMLENVSGSMIAGEYMYSDMQYDVEEYLDMIDKIEISEDIVCHLYVDGNGMWSRLRMPSIMYSAPAYLEGDPAAYSVSLDLILDGGESPLDNLQMEIAMNDMENDVVSTVRFSRKAGLENGVAKSVWKIAVDDKYTDMELVLDYFWDQNTVSGENLVASLSCDDGWAPFVISLNATLSETPSTVALTEGQLRIEAYDDITTAKIDYIQKEILPEELAIDSLSTTPLFDIDPMELMQTVQDTLFSLMSIR